MARVCGCPQRCTYAWKMWTTKGASSRYGKWVVYCKPPFQNVGRVLEYLGRYPHRVVDGQLTFRGRDYQAQNRQKHRTLSADEFLRRFPLHVLPSGFIRIRHYGILSPRNKANLRRCQRLTRTIIPDNLLPAHTMTLLAQLTGRDYTQCPACGVGHLQPVRASPARPQLHSRPPTPLRWGGKAFTPHPSVRPSADSASPRAESGAFVVAGGNPRD